MHEIGRSGFVDLIQAVRELREHLNYSQQAFASRLGLSIRAVANYEKDRQPSGKALAELAHLAKDSGRGDLAQMFASALARELGYGPGAEVKILDLHRLHTVTIEVEEKADVEALLLMLRNREACRTELAAWARLRDRVLKKAKGGK
jgi:transcriptional regulator with XRE-family HTH domain